MPGTYWPEVAADESVSSVQALDQHLTSRGTGKNLHGPLGEKKTGNSHSDSSGASKLKGNIYEKVIDWIRWIRAC